MYGSACSALTERTDCQFQNPLLMNPRLVASNLRCLSSQWATDSNAASSGLGKCMLGPNRHGDACNDNAECASGTCSLRLKLCAGVAGGQSCTASTPDPCAPGFYCASGVCAPQFQAAAPGAPLTKCGTNAQSCARGLFCAGQSDGNAYCTPPYSVAPGVNTTLGPYMCASGNAYMLVQGATNAGSVYQCLASAPTLAGNIAQDAPLCSSGAPLVPGQTCQCAADNYMRVTTIGGVGLGARAAIWQNLYQCLQNARGVTGDPCQFDASDMEAIRYGSCAYYACFPHYVQLATTTGARFLSPPLSYFDPSAACEKTAARNYYATTASTPCISIMGMENWQCILGPRSLSVAATNGVIAVIFIIVWGGYLYREFFATLRRTAPRAPGGGIRAMYVRVRLPPRARPLTMLASRLPPFSRVRASSRAHAAQTCGTSARRTRSSSRASASTTKGRGGRSSRQEKEGKRGLIVQATATELLGFSCSGARRGARPAAAATAAAAA